MGEVWTDGIVELRLGRWQKVLADVGACDALIFDAPYSARTHAGAGSFERWGTTVPKSYDGANLREIGYAEMSLADVDLFAESWAPRCAGWSVSLTDDEPIVPWRRAFESRGRTCFQDVPCVIRGMAVRRCGDGPSSWAVHAAVSRPPALSRWGTLPGAYVGPAASRGGLVIGSKPEWLMCALVRDYSRPGDLIVDPFAGSGTTLLAARLEGRRAIGAECDPKTFALAVKRLSTPWTPRFFQEE